MNRANCDDCGSQWDDEQTAPVGSFAPNAFGLYDMHGNVWEWVEDCWNASYSGAPSNGTAWLGGECTERVLRGGSWLDDPRDLRAADRGRITSGIRLSNIGFRVARDNLAHPLNLYIFNSSGFQGAKPLGPNFRHSDDRTGAFSGVG